MIAARRRPAALILTGAQFIGYLLVFTIGSVALVAMFITSLLRAPDPAVDTVLAALALVLIVAISSRVIRTHRPRG